MHIEYARMDERIMLWRCVNDDDQRDVIAEYVYIANRVVLSICMYVDLFFWNEDFVELN